MVYIFDIDTGERVWDEGLEPAAADGRDDERDVLHELLMPRLEHYASEQRAPSLPRYVASGDIEALLRSYDR